MHAECCGGMGYTTETQVHNMSLLTQVDQRESVERTLKGRLTHCSTEGMVKDMKPTRLWRGQNFVLKNKVIKITFKINWHVSLSFFKALTVYLSTL